MYGILQETSGHLIVLKAMRTLYAGTARRTAQVRHLLRTPEVIARTWAAAKNEVAPRRSRGKRSILHPYERTRRSTVRTSPGVR